MLVRSIAVSTLACRSSGSPCQSCFPPPSSYPVIQVHASSASPEAPSASVAGRGSRYRWARASRCASVNKQACMEHATMGTSSRVSRRRIIFWAGPFACRLAYPLLDRSSLLLSDVLDTAHLSCSRLDRSSYSNHLHADLSCVSTSQQKRQSKTAH